MRRNIVIGNWKLHGTQAFVSELLREFVAGWVGVHQAEVVVCPALVHLSQAYTELAHSNIAVGAQDVSAFEEGAYTGEVSGEMLHDIGCQYALVGHSERRRHHQESNELVAKKFDAALKAHLLPVMCIGETEQERNEGKTFEVLTAQLNAVLDHCDSSVWARAIIGYEPVWAIGTGKVATPEIAQEVHAFIRTLLGDVGAQTRIIYGGSVTADNAAGLFAMPDIDGALVGGASLKAPNFLQICRAAE